MSAARSSAAATGIIAALAAALAACTPEASPAAAGAAPPIARVHERQCGRCHSPPEPGSHTRAQLEDAFSRHRKRVHLTSGEWAAMVDYLAAADASATLQKP